MPDPVPGVIENRRSGRSPAHRIPPNRTITGRPYRRRGGGPPIRRTAEGSAKPQESAPPAQSRPEAGAAAKFAKCALRPGSVVLMRLKRVPTDAESGLHHHRLTNGGQARRLRVPARLPSRVHRSAYRPLPQSHVNAYPYTQCVNRDVRKVSKWQCCHWVILSVFAMIHSGLTHLPQTLRTDPLVRSMSVTQRN